MILFLKYLYVFFFVCLFVCLFVFLHLSNVLLLNETHCYSGAELITLLGLQYNVTSIFELREQHMSERQ